MGKLQWMSFPELSLPGYRRLSGNWKINWSHLVISLSGTYLYLIASSSIPHKEIEKTCRKYLYFLAQAQSKVIKAGKSSHYKNNLLSMRFQFFVQILKNILKTPFRLFNDYNHDKSNIICRCFSILDGRFRGCQRLIRVRICPILSTKE